MSRLLAYPTRPLPNPTSALAVLLALITGCSESTAESGSSGDGGFPEGGAFDSGIPPVPTDAGNHPLSGLQGDYLRRVDTVSHTENSVLGTVTSDASSFGILRVVLQDDRLIGVERLCHYEVSQDAEQGTLTTTVSPTLWPNLEPVTRQLDVDLSAGTWSAPAATRRQGFRASAGALPTDPVGQADDFLDPDEDGAPGVTTRVTGQVSVLQADCEYTIVSAATTKYVAGQLDAQGRLASASVEAISAESHALTAEQVGGSAPCDVDDINEAAPPTVDSDMLRLAPVAGGWLSTDDACPSLSEFEAALP